MYRTDSLKALKKVADLVEKASGACRAGEKPAEECSVNRIHLTAVFSERIARFRGITAQICASTTSMRLLPGRSVAVLR